MTAISGKASVPAIPEPGRGLDTQTRQAMLAIRELLKVREGLGTNKLDRYVTLRDLLESGLASIRVNGRVLSGGGGNSDIITAPVETVIPPAPTNLQASGVFTMAILQWDKPTYARHGFTEILRSDIDDPGTAQVVGVSYGYVYSDPLDMGATVYYWVRFVSESEHRGPLNATAGTQATTSQDPSKLLEAITGEIRKSHLHQTLSSAIDTIELDLAQVIADLAQEVIDRTTADTLLDTLLNATAADVTSLQSALETTSSNVSANTSAISGLATRVTDAEGQIDSISTQVTSLTSRITDSENDLEGQGSAISGLTTRVTAAENGISAISADVTELESKVNHPQTGLAATSTAVGNLETRVTEAEGEISSVAADVSALTSRVTSAESGITAQGTALSNLTTRVTTAEGAITSLSSSVSGINSRLDDPATGLAASASGISQLTTRVGAAEGDITALANDLAALQAVFEDPDIGLGGIASLVEELETRVTSTESGIAAHSSAINTLQTSVGDNTSSIQTLQTTTNGLVAQYAVRLDVNGRVIGFGLYNEPTSSLFLIHVDRFAIGAPGSTTVYPFIVDGNVVYMDVAMIRDASITSAKIQSLNVEKLTGDTAAFVRGAFTSLDVSKLTGNTANFVLSNIGTASITTAMIQNAAIAAAKIADAAVTTAKIANLAVTTAKVANAAITDAKIANASVGTLKIAGNAVTYTASQTGSSVTADASGWETLCSLVFNHGYSSAITGLICIGGEYDSGRRENGSVANARFRLLVGGSVVYTSSYISGKGVFLRYINTSLAAGNVTLTFQWDGNQVGYQDAVRATFQNYFLVCTGAKR